MSEKPTGDSVAETQASGQDAVHVSDSQNQEKQDQVAYDTYRKTLGEAKKYKSETQELRQKLEEYEKAQLEEQGKYQDLYSKIKQERDEIYQAKRDLELSIAEERIRSQVVSKAKELGCIDTDALTKLVGFDGLDVDDSYNVSGQSLDMVLKKAKQDKPYLFSKPQPTIRDGVPAKDSGKIDLNSLKKDDLIAYAKKLGIR
jgi:hypothetical protein